MKNVRDYARSTLNVLLFPRHPGQRRSFGRALGLSNTASPTNVFYGDDGFYPDSCYAGRMHVHGVNYSEGAMFLARDIKDVPSGAVITIKTEQGRYEDSLMSNRKLAGTFGKLGSVPGSIYLAEDHRSAVTLHLAAGSNIACAMHVSNFKHVAAAITAKSPSAQLIFCVASDDPKEFNRKQKLAEDLARSFNAKVLLSRLNSFGDHEGSLSALIDEAYEPCEPWSNEDAPDTELSQPETRWASPVHGSLLVEALVKHIQKFVSLTEDDAILISIWILFSHLYKNMRVAPILSIISPTKRCGKTTLLNILTRLAARPIPMSSGTEAVVYQLIEKDSPTLIFDEADTYQMSKRFVGILNAGHTPSNAYVYRSIKGAPVKYSVFCPKIFACIGALPPTIMDRSIPIKMQRARADEKLDKYHPEDGVEDAFLLAMIQRWCHDHLKDVKKAVPDRISLGNDRASDNFEPLLMIASVLGGGWEERLIAIGKKSASRQIIKQDNAELLLQDIKNVFDEAGVEKMLTKELLTHLHEVEERAWKTISKASRSPIGTSPTCWATLVCRASACGWTGGVGRGDIPQTCSTSFRLGTALPPISRREGQAWRHGGKMASPPMASAASRPRSHDLRGHRKFLRMAAWRQTSAFPRRRGSQKTSKTALKVTT